MPVHNVADQFPASCAAPILGVRRKGFGGRSKQIEHAIHRLTGTVESFAPASGAVFSLLPPENATGNFTKVVQRVPVRIAVPKDNALAGLLRPGLSVEVSVDTRAAGSGPTLAGAIFGAAQAATAN